MFAGRERTWRSYGARFLFCLSYKHFAPNGAKAEATRVSENYLTGVRLTTTDRWVNADTNRPTTRQAQIARARVFLEDIDELTDY